MSGSTFDFMTRLRSGVSLPRHADGFTFLGLLVIIVIIGVGLREVSEIWSTTRQREKEQELLFIGNQFRQAIGQYIQSNPQGKQIQVYPMSLDDMLLDHRYPSTQRYLRKIYTDPMTGKDEWGLSKNPNGSIYGVYSLSDQAPIKKDNFDVADTNFKGAEKYSSWIFAFRPQLSASSPAVTNSGIPAMANPFSNSSR